MLADASETTATVVVEQFGASPLNQQQVLVPVVVVVAPDRAHRYAGARLIDVGDAHLGGDVPERAVVHVAVQGVAAAHGAVGDVDIRPAVAVEIDDGDRRAHRRRQGHDGFQARVELRRLMHEFDAGGTADLFEKEPVAGQRLGLCIR